MIFFQTLFLEGNPGQNEDQTNLEKLPGFLMGGRSRTLPPARPAWICLLRDHCESAINCTCSHQSPLGYVVTTGKNKIKKSVIAKNILIRYDLDVC